MKLEHADRLKLSKFLKALASGKPPCSVVGICGNVEEYFIDTGIDRWFDWATHRGVCSKWKHYSGEKLFPVPDPRRGGKDNAHHIYWRTNNQWDKRTKYGRLRRDLALWLSEIVLTWENPEEREDEA